MSAFRRGRVLGQALDGFDRREHLLLVTQQHQREEFGKDDEVRFIVAGDIHEIAQRAEKFVVILHCARLQLARGDAHGLHPARQAFLHRLVAFHIGVAPDHQHRVAIAALVFGKIVFDDAFGFEPVGELEAQYRIVQLATNDLFQVVFRPVHLAAVAAVMGHAPAEDDAGQLALFGQRAAFLVQPPPDTHAAHLGIDAHLVAVQPVAGGIVAAAIAIARYLVPVVRCKDDRFGQLHAGAVSDHFLVQQCDPAAFGKVVDLPAYLALRIGGQIVIGASDQCGNAAHVLHPRITQLQTARAELFLLWPVFCHRTAQGRTAIRPPSLSRG